MLYTIASCSPTKQFTLVASIDFRCLYFLPVQPLKLLHVIRSKLQNCTCNLNRSTPLLNRRRAFLVYIAFFPEGAERDHISHNSSKSVSTFIYLDQPLTRAGVKARFELNLVLPNGKPVPWDNVVMAQHLLVAADKYGLERLKLMCENRLCSHIELKTVATTLSLADRHGCSSLKEACVKFIMYRGNLKSLMKTSAFEYLRTSCPALVNEFLAKVVT